LGAPIAKGRAVDANTCNIRDPSSAAAIALVAVGSQQVRPCGGATMADCQAAVRGAVDNPTNENPPGCALGVLWTIGVCHAVEGAGFSQLVQRRPSPSPPSSALPSPPPSALSSLPPSPSSPPPPASPSSATPAEKLTSRFARKWLRSTAFLPVVAGTGAALLLFVCCCVAYCYRRRKTKAMTSASDQYLSTELTAAKCLAGRVKNKVVRNSSRDPDEQRKLDCRSNMAAAPRASRGRAGAAWRQLETPHAQWRDSVYQVTARI